MPFAQACAAAGHDVVIATGNPFLRRLPLPTVNQLPDGLDLHWASNETSRCRPEAAGFEFVLAMFGEVLPSVVVPTLLARWEAERPDLVVYENMNVGAGIAADLLQIPAAGFAIGLWQPLVPTLHSKAVEVMADEWVGRGRPAPSGEKLLAGLHLDPLPAALQPTEVASIPHRLAVQAVGWSESTAGLPGWITAERTRPLVYITLGTVSFGAVDVLRRAIGETAGHPVDILVTVGPDGDPGALGGVPDNVRLERFVPQPPLLPHVDVMIHHGGTGTMLGALIEGIPQLILPQGADHFNNAAAVVRSGAGRALHNGEQLPGAIADAVGALLADGPERAAAQRIRSDIQALPAPSDVVPMLVRFARRR
jgi:hypothetical protein